MHKNCVRCGILKDEAANFRIDRRSGRHRGTCVECESETNRKSYARHRDKRLAETREYRSRQDVITKRKARAATAEGKAIARKHKKKYRAKECTKQKEAEYRKEYSKRGYVMEKARAAARAYRLTEKHREWLVVTQERRRDRAREYARKRRSSVSGTIHNRIARAISAQLRDGKKCRGTFAILGYSSDELIRHIERQFCKRMSWDKFRDGKIHIDHIIPVSAFEISSVDDEEFKACWALANLRPMWASDNIKKGSSRITLL